MQLGGYMRNWNYRNGFALTLICVLFAAPVSAQGAWWNWSYNNRAPTISGTPDTTVRAGSAYSFVPQASDPDTRRLTFYIWNKPAWAVFNSRSGRLTGTPSAADAGTYSDISIRVSDGRSWAALSPFSIVVTGSAGPPDPNRGPSIAGSPGTSVQAGGNYSFAPSASDPDGDPLQFMISNAPSWAGFSATTGALTGTPTLAQVGTYSNIVISVSDGTATASLPPFAISVTAPVPVNLPPTITGVPATSVVANSTYRFTPGASDPDGDPLGFVIIGKPAWATFSTSTGTLTGTPGPAQAGIYLNIGISVSDGKATASLPVFAITVTSALGTATLSWTAPTQNVDGSELRNLAGYRVYHGTSPNQLDEMIQLPGAATTSYVFNQLARGTHYFAVSAYTSAGAESEKSNTGSKTIP